MTDTLLTQARAWRPTWDWDLLGESDCVIGETLCGLYGGHTEVIGDIWLAVHEAGVHASITTQYYGLSSRNDEADGYGPTVEAAVDDLLRRVRRVRDHLMRRATIQAAEDNLSESRRLAHLAHCRAAIIHALTETDDD